MRKQWFGDTRDYVKWSVVWQESEPDLPVLYVAMARPDEIKGNVHKRVREFFEKHKDFSLIKALFNERIEVISDPYFNQNHSEYFADVLNRIEFSQKSSPIVVFLDPDTGIQPRSGASDKHVRLDDLEAIASRLQRGSRLLIYQHATQDKRIDWKENARQRFSSIPSAHLFDLRIAYDKPCAHDVCFLVAQRK